MTHRSSALATAALLVASPLHAQHLSLRLGGLRAQYADTIDASAGSAGAQLTWTGTKSQGVVEASWAQFDTGSGAGQLWGSYAALGPRSQHAGLGVRLDGVTNAIEGSTWTALATSELFGALTSHGWTLATGVSIGGVRDLYAASFATAGAAMRTWYERGNWSIGGAAAATTSTNASLADFTASAEFHRGRVIAGALAGGRRGDLGGPPWYQGHASVLLNAVVSLETAFGSYPKDLAGFDRGRYANVSLRIRLSTPRTVTVTIPSLGTPSRSLLIEVLDSDHTRVTFALDAASTPAIAGSWNDWSPAPLARTDDGRWSAILPIGAGTYRFAIVLDGGRWIVPEGVTRLPDDFDGEVGILVVRR